MKTHHYSWLFASLLFVSCEKSELPEPQIDVRDSAKIMALNTVTATTQIGTSLSRDLYANSAHRDTISRVGYVKVWNDRYYLYVTTNIVNSYSKVAPAIGITQEHYYIGPLANFPARVSADPAWPYNKILSSFDPILVKNYTFKIALSKVGLKAFIVIGIDLEENTDSDGGVLPLAKKFTDKYGVTRSYFEYTIRK